MSDRCVQCKRETRALTSDGFCPGCDLNARAVFTFGYATLLDYLLSWHRFREWERTHEVPA